MTDSAEESEENEEHAQPPVTTTAVTTPTPSVRRPGAYTDPYVLLLGSVKGLRHEDLADYWPKTILETSASQLKPLRIFSMNI